MSMNRQQRRALLRQSVEAVEKRGIDLRAPSNDQIWSVIGATRAMLDILESRDPARASNAARWAHEFFEKSLARNTPEHKIACSKGCHFCCHVIILAMAPELLLLARHIREKESADFEAALARIRAADAETRNLNPLQRAQLRRGCAMLVDQACSVYEARPGACRGLTSISAEACRRALAGENVPIYTPRLWTTVRNAHKQALWAALDAAGLPAHSYELHHGLRVALETPDAEARWLAGEDIFAAVAREGDVNAETAAHNRRIIATLVAGATGKEFPA